MINVNPAAGVAALNGANPNQLAEVLRAIALGDVVRALPIPLNGFVLDGSVAGGAGVAATNPYVLAAAESITLPDDAKCGWLFGAYARAGTGTKAQLTVDNNVPEKFSGSEPAAGHVAVAPSGDLLFNHVDAWTSVDVLYMPMKYAVMELSLPVASSVLTLPLPQNRQPPQFAQTAQPSANFQSTPPPAYTAPGGALQAAGNVMIVMEVEALVGTVTGKKIIDVIGTAPAAGHAALQLTKLTVDFQATDAVTSARVKFGTYHVVDLNTVLETAAPFYP